MARMTAVNRKRIAEMKAKMRRGRVLQVRRSGKPEIPAKVIKQLGALGLPPNPWVYEACLEKLLRGT